jgi:hypothetical protein|tara:strand:+ start:267 stop:446 length:180 start_codon:yes stop_codon:yes gene_type:complete
MAKYKIEYLTEETKRCGNGKAIGHRDRIKFMEIESENIVEDLKKLPYIKKLINTTKINN